MGETAAKIVRAKNTLHGAAYCRTTVYPCIVVHSKMTTVVRTLENDIQGACQGALQAYFRDERKKYTQFAPYSNQQSANAQRTNLFAADVIGIIEDSSLLMLEMKYCDVYEQILPRFELEQHTQLKALEDCGVAVHYCYNGVDELAYFRQEDWRWPEITLRQLRVSPPKQLPHKYPHTHLHGDLLSWIERVRSKRTGGDCFDSFASLLNGTLRPGQVRNQVMVLLYSNKMQHMVGMDEVGLREFAHWIVSHPTASNSAVAKHANRIKQHLTPAVRNSILLDGMNLGGNTQHSFGKSDQDIDDATYRSPSP